MTNVIVSYTAISLSIMSRLCYLLLLYQNKSKKSLSLVISTLGLASSSVWIYYSLETNDKYTLRRSLVEIGLHSISSAYIIYNKVIFYNNTSCVLPTHIVKELDNN